MGSRNENSVKNRFFSLLHKFKKKKNVENDQDSILSILKNLKDLNPEAISNKMIKTIQRQTLIDKLKKSVESQNKFRFKIEPKNLKRPNSMTQKKKKAQIITCNNDKGDSLVERNLSSLIIDSPMVQKHIKLEDPIIYKEISRKPQKEQSSPESGKIKIEIELKNSTPESILTKKLSNTHNKTISLENIQKEQIHLNESRYAASQNFFPNNNFFPQENIFNPPNNYFNQGNFFPQNNYFPMFRPKENLMPQMPQENQMIKKNSFSSRHNDILSKDTIIIRDNLMNAVMSENYPNNFQIPYTHPNFLNNQFPFFYYQVPIIDPFNEEFLKNAGLFKNSMEINEPDLKNISQLVSSLSLTDEYLLEGQKLLSDLTFKSNSPGSFQDRLSNIIPNSGKSISSKRLLHHSPPPPESLLLRPKTCRNNLETIDEKKWKSNKNEKKILIYNCFNPDNFIKEGMEEEIIKSGKFADNKKNSSISFDRH